MARAPKSKSSTATPAAQAGTSAKVAKRGHLFLKRFADNDKFLTAGARKRVKHDVAVGFAPTARGSCVYCGAEIAKGALRVTLMLQCHKGYKNASLCHMSCFPKHPESSKIDSIDEFLGVKELPPSGMKELETAFNSRLGADDVSQPPVKAETKQEEVETEATQTKQLNKPGKGRITQAERK